MTEKRVPLSEAEKQKQFAEKASTELVINTLLEKLRLHQLLTEQVIANVRITTETMGRQLRSHHLDQSCADVQEVTELVSLQSINTHTQQALETLGWVEPEEDDTTEVSLRTVAGESSDNGQSQEDTTGNEEAPRVKRRAKKSAS